MKLAKIIFFFLICSSYAFSSTPDLHRVTNVQELYRAVDRANKNQVPDRIEVAPGTYKLSKRLYFEEPNTQLAGASGVAEQLVLKGMGMRASPTPEVLIDVAADHISISHLTLESVSHHLIQVRAEADADHFTLTNCVLRDAYQQLLKVSGSQQPEQPHADHGHISHCLFEYSAGIGPQYYIGGIDAHRVRNWTITNNTFKAIASPAKRVAQHAIHIWNNSSNNIVSHNTIVNSDRGIGFGMGRGSNQHSGGEITYNLIIHTAPHHPYADVGIILESSPDTLIKHNTILLYHRYPNAIEYRFKQTQGVTIQGNTVNRRIASRNGGAARVLDNKKLK